MIFTKQGQTQLVQQGNGITTSAIRETAALLINCSESHHFVDCTNAINFLRSGCRVQFFLASGRSLAEEARNEWLEASVEITTFLDAAKVPGEHFNFSEDFRTRDNQVGVLTVTRTSSSTETAAE